MAVGAVSFHNEDKVKQFEQDNPQRKYIEIEKDKDILKKIWKTKEEKNNLNLEKEKELRMQAEKKEKIAFYKQQVCYFR